MKGQRVGAGVGEVETQFFTFGTEDEPFVFASGETLAPVTLAYEIYGELNDAKDNAILLFHALTGSHHAAGYNPSVPGTEHRWTEEMHVGWWDNFIGPGRGLNTDKFAVICVNYVGGCYGSTGPASTNPVTNKQFGGGFPRVTIGDQIDAQVALLDALGIEKLHAVVGGSVGGYMTLDFAVRYHERVRNVIPIASGLRATPLHTIYNFEQANAILNDPNFCDGDFYEGPPPDAGLALARMIGHKTFVSLQAMERRARAEILGDADQRVRYPMESYMWHQGQKFVKRFDANTYLRAMWMWQDFDLVSAADARGVDVADLFCRDACHDYLVFSIDSDVCFYPEEQRQLTQVLQASGAPVRRITVHSPKGHDSFLLDDDLLIPHLRHQLESEWDPGDGTGG